MKEAHTIEFSMVANAGAYPANALFGKGQLGDVYFSLSTNEKGNLIADISYKYLSKRTVYQSLYLKNQGEFVIKLKFNKEKLSCKLSIKGLDIMSESQAAGMAFLINANELHKRIVDYPDFSQITVPDESEQLFLRTVGDLNSRLDSDDLYTTVKAAGILRLLLLDTPSLLDIINRKYQLKLEYHPFDYRLTNSFKRNEIMFGNNILIPLVGQEHLAPSKLRNAFIKVPCGYLDEHVITVEDVIQYCSNKAGGVHFDQSSPKKPGQAKVKEIDSVLRHPNKPIYNAWLHEIIFLTLQGIKPLVDMVLSNNDA